MKILKFLVVNYCHKKYHGSIIDVLEDPDYIFDICIFWRKKSTLEGELQSLSQFLANENPLKMMSSCRS